MSQQQQQQHYALVSKLKTPLKIEEDEDDDNEDSNSNDNSNNGSPPSCKDGVRQELVQIYETYADLYPNPKLIAERRQRDTLLQASRAASTFQQQQQFPSKKKKQRSGGGGFLSFLFGGGGAKEEEEPSLEPQSERTTNAHSDVDNDDTLMLLSYTDIPNPLDDGQLCETQQSLDTSCIPEEVYSIARSHLTSTKTRRTHPNALRGSSSNNNKYDNNNATMYIVVGLGKIAVFDDDNGGEVEEEAVGGMSSYIMTTSDRDELRGYSERSKEFDVHSVRGVVLSPNCIAVSWGFFDGLTVVYRRVQVEHYLNGHGWEAVWMVGPSPPVLENMPDLFHDDQDQPGSPLLRISDIVPLSVQVDLERGGEKEPHQVITLAISRLGGYIELVPLPTKLWAGSAFTLDEFRPPKHKMRKNNKSPSPNKRKRSQPHPHYALGKNIACPPQTIALTTIDYHVDIQALEAYRTSVNSETAWDDQAFPDAPPAEFVLAASGMTKDGNHDMITFWTVSTLFPETPSLDDDIGFNLHSGLIEAINVPTGSSVSIFASSGIMQQWRTPRQVELKDEAETIRGDTFDSDTPIATKITTLSTVSPVVAMRFSDGDGSTSSQSGPFLSVLDWNGGVQIVNCSTLGRVASQNMPLQEYDAFQRAKQEEEDPVPFPLVHTAVARCAFPVAVRSIGPTSVTSVQWVGSGGFGTDGTMPPLALLVDGSSKLGLLTFSLPPEDTATHAPLESSYLSLSFSFSGAAMKCFGDTSLSFVALQRGLSKGSGKPTLFLNHFVMEQLQPVAIVKSLARDAKYGDAIDSASKLSPHEQASLVDVVKHCHQKLWELTHDVTSLEATGDSSYIVRQAWDIYEGTIDSEGFSLETLSCLLKLALSCSERSKDTSKAAAIRKRIVRLGSYQLLCRFFGSVPSIHQFLGDFSKIEFIQLMEQLARRADLRALSMLLFRHRKEIGPRQFFILSLLPPSLDPMHFCHMLPVIRSSSISDYFLSTQNGNVIIPWSHMPQFLLETQGFAVVLGLLDEKAVLDYNKGTSSPEGDDLPSTESVAADWFLSRAKAVQTFVGDIDAVIRLCELGLMCLSKAGMDADFVNSPIPLKQVYSTWKSAVSLQRMMLDGVVSVNGDGIGTDDLMSMNLTQLLDLVLKSTTDSKTILYRFQEYVHPLILRTESSRNGAEKENVDQALATYCIKEASKCWDCPISAVQTALESCSAIADCSKTTIPRRDRLIKNTSILVTMVIESTSEILDTLSTQAVGANNQQEILQVFWRLFETLPSRLGKAESSKEALISSFYQKLVFIDIMTRWPGTNGFSMVQTLSIDQSATGGCLERGKEAITLMCKSFCDMLSKVATEHDRTSLLQDVLSDAESMDRICFDNSVGTDSIVSMNVIPKLLAEGYFDLIAAYLRWNGPSVDKITTERMVSDYVDNAVFSEIDDSSKIHRAIQCQDVLGPLLPEAKTRFQSMRRFLDASHFISTVLFDGKDAPHLSPLELKGMNGLDAIESVLRSVPENVVCGSSQWMDEVFADGANRALRHAKATVTAESLNDNLPALPGGAIFHLATILALEDNRSVIAVKCRVIHHAVECGFYGAAAAVARTLVSSGSADGGLGGNEQLAKLGAIAEVVTKESYPDLVTKRELCDGALSHCGSSLIATSCDAFAEILQTSTNLNVATSRFNQQYHQIPRERKELLLERPLARLYKHVFYEYNADVHVLFLDLVKQAEQQEVHDSLMNALSRFVFYWCIHDSKTLKNVIDLWDVADAHDNLALGCSILLQIPSRLTAANCVRELQKIAADQAATVETAERFGSNSICHPDEELVRRLIHRGYGKNAARRSVAMTGNAGYNEALGWAVMHTMDPDFNEPPAVTRPTNKLRIDQDSIHLLQQSLSMVSKILEDPQSRTALLRYISSQHQQELAIDSSKQQSSDKQPVLAKGIANKPRAEGDNSEKMTSSTLTKKVPSPIPVTRSKLAKQILASTPTKPPVEQKPLGRKAESQAPTPEPQPLLKLPIQSKKPPPPQLQSNGISKNTSSTTIHAKANTTKHSDLNREELRKRGQAALVKLRGKTEDANRRRLIEEGRQLLKQSRSGLPSAANKSTVPSHGNGQSKAAVPLLTPPAAVAFTKSVAATPATPKWPLRPPIAKVLKVKPISRSVATKVIQTDVVDKNAEEDGWDFEDF